MSGKRTGWVLGGRYVVESELGSGGAAEVYGARDQQLERPVAVKILRAEWALVPGIAADFQREAELAARLHHPHLVQVYDSGVEAGRPYIVMERVPGTPLDRVPRPPVGTAVAIAAQIAGALAFAHDHGLLHGDVKPANVLVDPQEQAKLVDFGGAAPTDEIAAGAAPRNPAGATQPLPVVSFSPGTLPYLAPERLGGGAASAAADVYSLGAVLYALLAGRPPYPGATRDAVRQAQQAGAPPPLRQLNPAVPPALDALVRRALAPDPAARFGSAAELETALTTLRDEFQQLTQAVVPVPPPPVPRGRTPPMPRSRTPPWALLAAGALLVALLVLIALLGRSSAAPGAVAGAQTAVMAAATGGAGTPSGGTAPPGPGATAAGTATASGVSPPPPVPGTATRAPAATAVATTPSPVAGTATPPPSATPIRTPTAVVVLRPAPKLTGLLLADAAARAKAEGYALHAVTGEYSSTVPRFRVLTQQPAPGTPIPPGAPIRVTYSRGPPPR